MLFSLELHGDMDQFERNKVKISAFKKQDIAILIATDVADKKCHKSYFCTAIRPYHGHCSKRVAAIEY